MLNKIVKTSLLSVSIAAILAGCGGGGGGSASTPASQSRVVDGPLAGATVLFEDCNQATTETDAQGYFQFPAGCASSAITVSGGIDTTTGIPFSDTLTAPRSAPGGIISPLSTLLDTQSNTATAATQLATALGLSGVDILTTDPLSDQTLYTKTVTTHHVVEQVKVAIYAATQANLPDNELTLAVYKALANALINGNGASLSDVAVINSTIQNAFSAVKSYLDPADQSSLANIAANTAQASAPVIAANVATVESILQNVSPSVFAGGIAAIEAATKDAIQAAKFDHSTHNVVQTLAPVFAASPASIAAPLSSIAQAVSTGDTSGTTINDALHRLNTFSTAAATTLANAAALTPQYVSLEGFARASGEVPMTYDQLVASLTTPISINTLDYLQVSVASLGSNYAGQVVNMKAGLLLETEGGSKLFIAADEITLEFDNNGVLDAGYIKAGKVVRAKTEKLGKFGLSANFDQKLPTQLNINTDSALDLNIYLLSALMPGNDFGQFRQALKGKVVTATAVLTPLNGDTVAVNHNGTDILAPRYDLGNIGATVNSSPSLPGYNVSGYGVQAKFAVRK